jgi:Amt family ammonium transporter
MFWLVGYNLAYGIPEGGYIGTFTPWSDASKLETGYSDGSDWFFQMVFCATTMSIVSGTLAERIKIWPFFLFACNFNWNYLSNFNGLAVGWRMVICCWIL